jgi:ribosomal protein L29
MDMKLKELKQELQAMNAQQLKEKVDVLRRELFGLRLNATTSHVKDYSQIAKLKRGIAMGLTYVTQKTQAR